VLYKIEREKITATATTCILLARLIVSAVLPAEQYYLVHQHMVEVAAALDNGITVDVGNALPVDSTSTLRN
jgi:hypothetical protein